MKDQRRKTLFRKSCLPTRVGLWAVLCALAIIVGCRDEGYKLRFSHFQHVKQLRLECALCHGEMRSGKFSLPGHDQCKDCHGEKVETKKIAKETCGACHVEKNLDEIGKQREIHEVTRGVFRHSEALVGRCDLCHGLLYDSSKEFVFHLSRDEVLVARSKGHASGLGCEVCHDGLDKGTPPTSHKENWKRTHGIHYDADKAACTVCHQEESCRECHQKTKPERHNSLWRLKAHGIWASARRDYCRTCHRDDYCDGCHKDTKPRSHRADWRRRHCFHCHSSASMGTGCVVCHSDAGISRHSANVPDGHPAPTAGMDCLACHLP